MRRIWPRAQSKLYEEPKKLVAHGFARATDDPVGRRRRTRYTITAKGRRALAAWLQEPGDGPVLEFEQLLKIGFADGGSKADIVTNLEADSCVGARAERGEPGRGPRLSRRQGGVPRRAALNQLTGRFLTDFYVMVANWTAWASRVVEAWPDDVRDVPFDVAVVAEVVRRVESIAVILDSATTSSGPP